METDNERVALEDVLIGEVWIASGQSNMQWPMAQTHDAEATIDAAQHSQIRLLTVPRTTAFSPRTTIDASWQICTPETARPFSAVAYSLWAPLAPRTEHARRTHQQQLGWHTDRTVDRRSAHRLTDRATRFLSYTGGDQRGGTARPDRAGSGHGPTAQC